jgi:alkanesulfonate monooxygenase SsuD/methylene tetrahydromethanopterin reductase-like flavin-dependent oxidoreductase (luciferase family)
VPIPAARHGQGPGGPVGQLERVFARYYAERHAEASNEPDANHFGIGLSIAIEATARDVDALVLLSEVLNYDFAKKPLDEPFSDEELAELSFQGFRDRVIRHSGKRNPTVRDFITVSGRGTVKEHTMFCGNPQQVADQMKEWFTAPACDGFVLAASSMLGAAMHRRRSCVVVLDRRAQERPVPRSGDGALLRVDLKLEESFDEAGQACHDHSTAPGAWTVVAVD